MHNPTIIRAPVSFFLGAGASSFLGMPLMAQFIGRLESKAGLKGDPLFDKIVGKQRDLEFLLGELEEWSGKDYYSPVPILGGFGTIESKSTHFEDELRSLIYRADELNKKIRHEVFETYRQIQWPQGIQNFHLPLFESAFHVLHAAGQPLVVFTTNYDPAVETFCRGRADECRLCDGFVAQWNAGSPIWHRESIDQLQLGATSQKDLVLFKLHGSTSWFKRENEFIKSDAAIYAADDPSFKNLLIYPARKKVATEEPFFTAYDYFQRCMENCRLCITIGYSFRDEDALSRLRSAAGLNHSLKVLVIDPNSADICSRKLIPLGIRAEPIGVSFGDLARWPDLLRLIREELAATAAGAM